MSHSRYNELNEEVIQPMIDMRVREHAMQLRRQGYLYGQIARSLHIAKSTAYLWTKDILLTEDERNKVAATLSGAR